jgi:hypothetical protein
MHVELAILLTCVGKKYLARLAAILLARALDGGAQACYGLPVGILVPWPRRERSVTATTTHILSESEVEKAHL